MMSLKQQYGSLALVTGASEGIGAAFSEYLAKEGLDLILVARRKEPLEQFAATLIGKYGIKADCICCDLAAMNAAQELYDELQGKEINLLVYNAALSYIGPFEKNSIEHHNRIAQANMITPMNLLQFFGSEMLDKGKGAVILMASLAGFQGSGFLSVCVCSH